MYQSLTYCYERRPPGVVSASTSPRPSGDREANITRFILAQSELFPIV
ncbi:hypothetical protein [Desulfosporosinus sp. FKB]|nr:hypothetical protein [Desulfosporosinus sp. FKB]